MVTIAQRRRYQLILRQSHPSRPEEHPAGVEVMFHADAAGRPVSVEPPSPAEETWLRRWPNSAGSAWRPCGWPQATGLAMSIGLTEAALDHGVQGEAGPGLLHAIHTQCRPVRRNLCRPKAPAEALSV